MKIYVVNEFLKDNDGECLIHEDSRKNGYPDLESAENAVTRINDRLVRKGLVRQAMIVTSLASL